MVRKKSGKREYTSNPYQDRIVTLQLGTPEKQIVLDARNANLDVLKPLLESATLIGVNLKFDLRFLYHVGIRPMKVVDLMVTERLLWNGLPFSEEYGAGFQLLAKKYLDIDIDKELQAYTATMNWEQELDAKFIEYARLDVAHLHEIMEKQQQVLSLRKQTNAASLENAFVPVLADREYYGVHIDTTKLTPLMKESQKMADEKMEEINNILIANAPVNCPTKVAGKPKMMTPVVQYEAQKGIVTKSTVSWSSNEQALTALSCMGIDLDNFREETLIDNSHHKIIELILEWKKYNSIINKFLKPLPDFINPVSKRVHPQWNQMVQSGRESVSNPNVQQISSKHELGKMIRNAFVAPEGWSVITTDYSNFELRIIADMSGEPTWLKVFDDDGDLHSTVAAQVFNCDLSEVKTKKFNGTVVRTAAKAVNFLLSYGGSYIKLAANLHCAEDVAKGIIDNYYSKLPKLEQWLESQGERALQQGYAMSNSPIYRKRFVIPTKDKKERGAITRIGKNHPIQSTAADIVKLAQIHFYRYLQTTGHKAQMIMAVHDELVTITPDELVNETLELQEKFMIQAAREVLPTVALKVDSMTLKHWSK